jgi:mannose-1-phosphate guanylyltransferase
LTAVHAIVLVGGFGTRLRPLTNTVPKSMLPVGNEPIITRLVRRLEDSGVTTVTLSLGYLPDPFREAFPDDRCGGVKLRYAVDPVPLDTAGAIRFAAELAGVDDTFLALNGDIICDLDVGTLVAEHRRNGATATIHLTPVDDPSAFGVVELDGAGRVQRFLEKPAPGVTDSNLINAGTYVMEPRVLDAIPPGAAVNVERVTFPALAAGGELSGMATEDYWIDPGRPEQLLQANLDRLAGRYDTTLAHPVSGGDGVDPNAKVAVDAVVSGSVVAAGVVVGARSVVRRSVLLAGARIGEDVVVQDSVVMGHVGDRAQLRRAVVGAAAEIDPGQQVTDERIPDPG